LKYYEDPSNWHTFNEFFARHLSSPDQRPIASPNVNSALVSPCDAQPQGVGDIDENSNLVCKDGVNIKSGVFTSVEALLGDSEYKDAFAGGTLTHTFLDVNDYHRYHFLQTGSDSVMLFQKDVELMGRASSFPA
jgi:phosphatidylserine decarboxylase